MSKGKLSFLSLKSPNRGIAHLVLLFLLFLALSVPLVVILVQRQTQTQGEAASRFRFGTGQQTGCKSLGQRCFPDRPEPQLQCCSPLSCVNIGGNTNVCRLLRPTATLPPNVPTPTDGGPTPTPNPYCAKNNAYCTAPEQCCSRNCYIPAGGTTGTCQPVDGAAGGCRHEGESCFSSKDCCGWLLVCSGPYGNKKCVEAVDCKPEGAVCSGPDDTRCCGRAICQETQMGTYRCTALPTATPKPTN